MKQLNEIAPWKHVGTTEEGSDFSIRGVRVWQGEWNSVPGERGVYRLEANGQMVEFKVEEIHNGLYSFWVRNVSG